MGTGRSGDADRIVMDVRDADPVPHGPGFAGRTRPTGEGVATNHVHRPRRRLALVGLALALLIPTVMALWPHAPARVVVTGPLRPWYLDAPDPHRAPRAPERAPTTRWTSELPAHLELRDLAVLDDLVLALGVAILGPTSEHRVVAWDRTTGRTRWEAVVAAGAPARGVMAAVESGATFHVIGDQEIVSLAPSDVVANHAPEVGVDASNGDELWRRAPASSVRGTRSVDADLGVSVTLADDADDDPPDGAVTAATSQVVDLGTGQPLFTATGALSARRGGWVVARDGVVSLRQRDGSAIAILPQGDVVATLEDLVVLSHDAADGSRRLVAYDAAGSLAWTVPWRAEGTQFGGRGCSAPIGRAAGNELLVAAPFGPGCVHDLPLHVQADGTVSELDSALVQALLVDARTSVVAGLGEPFMVCAGDPLPGEDSTAVGCPHQLAAVHLDGSIRAARDDVVFGPWVKPATAPPGMATTSGLLLAEPEGLVLRRWADLEPVWTLEDPAAGTAQGPLVAIAEWGVAIGSHRAVDRPATVRWADASARGG